MNPTAQTSGHVQRIIFESNGYTVFQLKESQTKEILTVTGSFPELKEGLFLDVAGSIVDHPKFGSQLKANSITLSMPSDSDALVAFLSCGIFKGIGLKLAKAIVDHFGDKTRHIIENEPHRLAEVQKISNKKAKKVIESIGKQTGHSKLLGWLAPYGITQKKAMAIADYYGVNSIEDARRAYEEIKKNPYSLCREIKGIGFKTLDEYAQSIGVAPDSPSRIQAASLSLIEQNTSVGNCGIVSVNFLQSMLLWLKVDRQIVIDAVIGLIESGDVFSEYAIVNGERVKCLFPRKLYAQENKIRSKLLYLRDHGQSLIEKMNAKWNKKKEGASPMARISTLQVKHKDKLVDMKESQSSALRDVVCEGVSVITGGPGTGKTTMVKALIDLAEQFELKVLIAAPTGKAARRAQTTTGRKVCTIHRLLELEPGTGFKKCESDPLNCDLLIVDESSMIDASLGCSLLSAVGMETVVVFVGDKDQLPSIGAGKVLADIIDSDAIPVVRLSSVLRQSEESPIVLAAHKINSGEIPVIEGCDPEQYEYIEASKDEIIDQVRMLVKKALNHQSYGIDEIQVLSPMRIGELGTVNLNEVVGEILNPEPWAKQYAAENNSPDWEINHFDDNYRTGDRVMQTRNDYENNVFNGEVGVIKSINNENEELYVEYPEIGAIKYKFSSLSDIQKAFASTVHRYQGSECPCVIMVLANAHRRMLARNMAFTGLTRASERGVILCERSAMKTAIANITSADRITRLKGLLEQQAEEAEEIEYQ